LLDQRGGHAASRGPDDYRFGFARGWLDSLHVEDITEEFAEVLAREPSVCLLRRLAFLRGECYEMDLEALAQAPYLGNLRVFQFGEDSYHHAALWERSVDFLARLPRLEE